jgi:hypothetical protein
LEEETLYAYFAGLDISMDQTPVALKKPSCSTTDPTIPLIEFDGPAHGGDSFILNKSARS